MTTEVLTPNGNDNGNGENNGGTGEPSQPQTYEEQRAELFAQLDEHERENAEEVDHEFGAIIDIAADLNFSDRSLSMMQAVRERYLKERVNFAKAEPVVEFGKTVDSWLGSLSDADFLKEQREEMSAEAEQGIFVSLFGDDSTAEFDKLMRTTEPLPEDKPGPFARRLLRENGVDGAVVPQLDEALQSTLGGKMSTAADTEIDGLKKKIDESDIFKSVDDPDALALEIKQTLGDGYDNRLFTALQTARESLEGMQPLEPAKAGDTGRELIETGLLRKYMGLSQTLSQLKEPRVIKELQEEAWQKFMQRIGYTETRENGRKQTSEASARLLAKFSAKAIREFFAGYDDAIETIWQLKRDEDEIVTAEYGPAIVFPKNYGSNEDAPDVEWGEQAERDILIVSGEAVEEDNGLPLIDLATARHFFDESTKRRWHFAYNDPVIDALITLATRQIVVSGEEHFRPETVINELTSAFHPDRSRVAYPDDEEALKTHIAFSKDVRDLAERIRNGQLKMEPFEKKVYFSMFAA